MDGKGLGALESQAKMQLLIEVLRTRYAYKFALTTVGDHSSGHSHMTGRFHLFELRNEKESSPQKGPNFLALAYGLRCDGPVVVELVPTTK